MKLPEPSMIVVGICPRSVLMIFFPTLGRLDEVTSRYLIPGWLSVALSALVRAAPGCEWCDKSLRWPLMPFLFPELNLCHVPPVAGLS